MSVYNYEIVLVRFYILDYYILAALSIFVSINNLLVTFLDSSYNITTCAKVVVYEIRVLIVYALLNIS